ncbi:hypothetical protein [Polaromonas sp. UC242_47]|uniref:Imm32 family immunity protein n=1 Tax=Polaromonas sp. UC242_47 TaxID=3374626 RepID=UPI0037BA9198
MKIYGYMNQGWEPQHVVPEQLAEITLCATPSELRRMGEFLASCAAEMERMGDTYDHVHLGDRMKEFDGASPHFVVAKAEVS